MSNSLEDRRLERELEQFIRDGRLQAAQLPRQPAGARGCGWRAGARSSSSRPTTTSASRNQPEVVAAGKAALDRFGAGTASVRFICGTFTIHRALEAACARLVGTPASLSFVSCWNANEAVPGTLLSEQRHRDQRSAQPRLDHRRRSGWPRRSPSARLRSTGTPTSPTSRPSCAAARDRRVKMVITDGVFSMEGAIAQASRPDRALSQARRGAGGGRLPRHRRAGNDTGRGTAEHFGVVGEVDIITSTLGKALGGAAGGFVAGSAAVCDYLTQRARPQLFTNALPPTVAGELPGEHRVSSRPTPSA